MDSEWLANLTVEYVNKSGTHHPNEYKISVKFRLSDTVVSFLEHLSASYNGLQSCSSGKELHLLMPKGKMKRLDVKKLSTLESHGVRHNDHLELRGFRPISKRHYVYPLEVIDPDGRAVCVEVTNTTDMNALKHKLQNKTGVHASEIMLYCNSKLLPKKSLITVEFYGGKSSKKVLRMRYAYTHRQTRPTSPTKESQLLSERKNNAEQSQKETCPSKRLDQCLCFL